jgi:hypothetical protein
MNVHFSNRPFGVKRFQTLRQIDRHRDAAVTSLIPALSCRSCRPNAPVAEWIH